MGFTEVDSGDNPAHLLTHLTSSEAGKRLGMTKQGIRKLVLRGEINCLRTPLGLLFDPIEVERVRQARLRGSSSRVEATG